MDFYRVFDFNFAMDAKSIAHVQDFSGRAAAVLLLRLNRLNSSCLVVILAWSAFGWVTARAWDAAYTKPRQLCRSSA